MATPSLDCHLALGEKELGQGIELVSLADAAFLAQAVDVPASESGPLFRTMYPRSGDKFSEQHKDEIIRWHAEGIEEAIRGGRTSLRKLRHSDGRVVGLAAWVVERCLQEQTNEDKAGANVTKANCAADKRKIAKPWLPGALDVPAWLAVSEALKKERQKATRHLEDVCRRVQHAPTWFMFAANSRATYALGITIMSIRPEYQGQGLGSLLMQHICETIDRHDCHGYVLASPAGVGLYSEFGFVAIGTVDTPHGPITSMLRQRQMRSFT